MKNCVIKNNWLGFFSKARLSDHLSKMLNSCMPGTKLTGSNREMVIALIYCHPKAEEKVGSGIKDIYVRLDPIWKKHKQFIIKRMDDTEIDFSYKKCVFGDVSPLENFRHACRASVTDDIINFKIRELEKGICCPFRGLALDKDNSDVDHDENKGTFNQTVLHAAYAAMGG